MEIGELVGIGIDLVSKENVTCNEGTSEGKSHICKIGTTKDCTGTNLYKNVFDNKTNHLSIGLGNVPDKNHYPQWSLGTVTEAMFPVQAHHLIPKNELPDHPVCVWIAKAKKTDAGFPYKLKTDSDYDTDHHHNGYCMPYASPLKEWKSAKGDDVKLDVAYQVMDKTKVQLHQGSHPSEHDIVALNKRLAEAGQPLVPALTPPGPDSDADEDDAIERPCYLKAVNRFLDIVHGQVFAHVMTCQQESCGGKRTQAPIEVLPLKATIRMIDQVSKIIKILVTSSAMHVSWYSCAFDHSRKNLIVKKDGKWHIRDELAKQGVAQLKGG